MGNQFTSEDKKVKAFNNTVHRVKDVLSPLSPRKNKKSHTPKTAPKQSLQTPTAHEITTPNSQSTNPFRTPAARTLTNQWLKDTPARENFRFEDFTIDNECLGEGAFACVKLGVHKPSKKRVAVKIITKSKIPSDMKEYAITEPTYLAKLTHSNIINLYLTYEDEEYIYLFLEFVKGGDLYSLVESRGQLPQELAKQLFQQLVEAMLYCHSQNVCHRDIKLENVLIELNNTNEMNSKIKLIDFGFAADIPHVDYKFLDFPGSMLYAAPELLSGTPYDARVSDVYSMGVMLYLMLYGRYPFFSDDNKELYHMIMHSKPEFDLSFSFHSFDLLSKMLTPNPADRIRMDQILSHPFFVKEKKDILSPIKTRVNQLRTEVEKHSQNLKRLSLSPKTSRRKN